MRTAAQTLAGPAPSDALAANRGKRIGILVVAYNAATTLSRVLERIPSAVWSNIEEVAIFDDASQDATYALAVGLKTLSRNTKLSVNQHQLNLGYGGNQKAGYRYFLEKGFDIVVLLHGDGQYAPEVLAQLYHPIAMGEADAVFGSRMTDRYGGPLKGGMPLYKYLGNRILSRFENRALGLRLTEFHSGYRAYNLHALRQIDFTRMTDDFHFDTEIIIKLHHQGFRMTEVPIPTYYGDEICYVNGLAYAANVFRSVRRYRQTVTSIRKHPEFQEYFTQYAVKRSSHSSHSYLWNAVQAERELLDLGCGQGLVARQLKAAGKTVWGVDALTAPAHNEAFERYFVADLNDGACDLGTLLDGRQFRCVLLMDVLEHLARPELLLSQCAGILQPGGRLVVSVPNVANITVRLALLAGQFPYADRGILDRTHLRFFTRKSARRMLEDAGFEVAEHKMTVMPLELVFGSPERNPLVRAAHRVLVACTKLMPGLFGYQSFFVLKAKRGLSPELP